jgi:DNA anti-recombination protein RmuC
MKPNKTRKDSEMKKHIYNALFLMIALVIIISGTSCQEEQLQSERKTRLIADENIQLKSQLAERDETIERLKRRHAEQIRQKDELLKNCEQQKKSLKEQVIRTIDEQVSSVLAEVLDENAKSRDEINNLKEKIEKLEEQTKAKAMPSEAP